MDLPGTMLAADIANYGRRKPHNAEQAGDAGRQEAELAEIKETLVIVPAATRRF